MRLIKALLLLTLLIPTSLLSQERDKEILLNINGNSITGDEFLWMYNKNNQGENITSIEDYLDLYILFKLKVEHAKDEGFHLAESFSKELSGYRKQLAKGYLSDQTIKAELLQKSYERSKKEINVLHILIKCKADAIPQDSLDAYYKALKIRERIRLGEPFMSVARGASDDPTARFNGGNLGYLTVFQTPLTFEDAMYSMKIGSLSKPVRTSEGYHIIKIQDIRDESGRVKVAHIMKATPPGAPDSQILKAKSEIDSIYALLNIGSDFSELAKTYSDDKGSAISGGELPWFGIGQMVNEFSEKSFELLRDGDLSQPFKTIYGWHIVKRIDKEPPYTFAEKKNILESKMSQSYLESLGKKSLVEHLKSEYNYKLNTENLEWFYSIADSVFRSGNYKWYDKNIPNKDLYSFSDRSVSMKQFSDFISSKGKRAFSNDSLKYINTLIDLMTSEDLVKYEDSVLERKYPEFSYLMNEFHDGILLFEISNKMVWLKTNDDSSELLEYWEERKMDNLTTRKIEASIYTIGLKAGRSKTKKLAKEIKKMIKSDAGTENILKLGGSRDLNLISFSGGTFEKGENSVCDNIKWVKGVDTYTDRSGTHIIEINKVYEPEPIPYSEALPLIIKDYQNSLEKEWHQQLRDNYSVEINNVIFNNIKTEKR